MCIKFIIPGISCTSGQTLEIKVRGTMKYVKLCIQTLKVFILFTGCTILFYYAIMWISEEYQNHQRYEEPEGKAVKVASDGIESEHSWYDRLIMFYLSGE